MKGATLSEPRTTGPQRQLYAAEIALKRLLDHAHESGSDVDYEAYGSIWRIPREVLYATTDQIQWFIDYAVMPWAIREFPESALREVEVRESPSVDSYSKMYEGGSKAVLEIAFSRTSGTYRQLAVLHEMAHAIPNTGGHSKPFRDVEVALLSQFMSPVVGRLFEIMLHENQGRMNR